MEIDSRCNDITARSVELAVDEWQVIVQRPGAYMIFHTHKYVFVNENLFSSISRSLCISLAIVLISSGLNG